MLAFDHIAMSSVDLAEGVATVEAALGLRLSGGGEHPLMATHNRLMGLGDLYLEVIAPNPAALRPDWPRWFDFQTAPGFRCPFSAATIAGRWRCPRMASCPLTALSPR